MPDMALCNNKYCPSQDECYRHTATPSEYWQSYLGFRFICGTGKCLNFIPAYDDTAYHEFQRVNKVAA